MKQIKEFFQSGWRFTTIVDLVPVNDGQYQITTVGIAPVRDKEKAQWDYTALVLVDLASVNGIDNLDKCLSESENSARNYAVKSNYNWIQVQLIDNGFKNPIEYSEDHFKIIPDQTNYDIDPASKAS